MNNILRLCVQSFSHLGENEIKCWNEENSDIYEHEAIRFLVEKKDWAFVSDYVRLKVLYEHGGIYLDTDIQVIKPLPKEFYEADMIVGYAFDCTMSTAFIMVRSHHPFIKYLLDILEGHLKAGERQSIMAILLRLFWIIILILNWMVNIGSLQRDVLFILETTLTLQLLIVMLAIVYIMVWEAGIILLR